MQRSQGTAALDAYLADIDRRLREIQAELGPEGEPTAEPEPAPRAYEPEPPAPEPEPAPRAYEPEPPAPEPDPPAPEPEPPPPPAPEPERWPITTTPRDQPAKGRAPTGRGRDGPLAELLQRHSAPAPPPESPSLRELRTRLLDSIDDLLAGYEGVFEQLSAHGGGPAEVTISAGPFTSIPAVREFERELARVPGVVDVAIRGYEGADRAIIDVRIA